MFATQCTGALGIGNFQIIIYNSLGLKGYLPLLFYCMYTIVGTVPNFISATVMDRIGRRRLLREFLAFQIIKHFCQGADGVLTIVIGYPVLTAMLCIETALQKLYVGSTNQAGNAATVYVTSLP
jgi:hypothetical protein